MTPAEKKLLEESMAFLPRRLQDLWNAAAGDVAAEHASVKPRSCECVDWTQVGHPARAYWPDMHPSYHHPDCEKYTPPPTMLDGAKQPAVAGDNDGCGLPGCQGSKSCEEPGCEVLHPNACASDASVDGWRCHRHPPRRFEDLPKSTLVRLAESSRVVARTSKRYEVWQACAQLRALQGAIPMLKVLIDYLEPPREEHNGKSGWWHECLVCSGRYFHDGSAHAWLCAACSDAHYYEINLGQRREAAFWSSGPEQVGLYVMPGAKAAIAGHLRAVASYLVLRGEDELSEDRRG